MTATASWWFRCQLNVDDDDIGDLEQLGVCSVEGWSDWEPADPGDSPRPLISGTLVDCAVREVLDDGPTTAVCFSFTMPSGRPAQLSLELDDPDDELAPPYDQDAEEDA